MLDRNHLRRNAAAVRDALKARNYDFDLERFTTLEAERRRLQEQTEALQAERNARSKAIGRAKANGADIAPLVAEVGDLGQRLEAARQRFQALQGELDAFLAAVPNLPDASVPFGADEADNVELRTWGERPAFGFQPKDHVDLAGTALDAEAAVKIAGSRFVVMSGAVARLHRALTQFMLDVHTQEHGYQEVYVPYLVNTASLQGTGQLPKFEDEQFAVAGDERYYLIPTAETPVTNLVRDAILDAGKLPLRHVAHTPCFRREVGNYGKDTRGIFRQHQFEKVELVQIVGAGAVLASPWTNSPATRKPSCSGWSCPTGQWPFAAATSALPPPRPSTLRFGCRAKAATGRFPRAAISSTSKRAA